MREIKFRMWNKRDERMIYPDYEERDEFLHLFGDNSSGVYARGREDYIAKSQPNESFLMQFTGLKDKNGKEIYEGDIVKSGDLLHWKIIWYNYGWVINNKTEGNHILDYYGDEYEVVGNIYEDKELCKRDNK